VKKIRLTENQLIDLIKKSLNEVKSTNESQNLHETKYVALNPAFGNSAKAVASLMCGNVTSKTLQKIKAELEKWQGVFWEADGRCAIEKFLEYYTQYAKGCNTGPAKTLEADIAAAKEPGDAMFDDYKQEIYSLIKRMRQQCVDIDNKEKAAAKTAKEVLNACAVKEPGYVDQGDNFGIAFGKKGYIIGHKDGSKNSDGYNLWYWEYAKFHPVKKGQEAKDVAIAGSNGRCVNGVLDIDAWVKY
jgi:hypothetical protein